MKINTPDFAGTQRHPGLPAVPTMNETGVVKYFVFDLWAGLLVSKDTPAPAALRLSQALAEIQQQPEYRAELEASGVTAACPMSLEEVGRVYATDIARYRAIGNAIQL